MEKDPGNSYRSGDNTIRERGLHDTERESLYENKKFLKYALMGIGLILLIFLLYFLLNRDSHYEQGLQYLQDKQYSEALYEFQKVDPDEKDFRMAQSKINYINGLQAFQKGLNSQALLYLQKVDPLDEYYGESRLMIEKMNLANKQSQFESLSEKVGSTKDTIIIKQETLESPTETKNKTDAESSTGKSNKPALISMQRLVNQFESQYQTAGRSSVDLKNSYLTNMDSLYNEFTKINTSDVSDSRFNQINTTAALWMQKRIELIKDQISSPGSQSKIAQSIKEEGDKLYSKLLTLLNS